MKAVKKILPLLQGYFGYFCSRSGPSNCKADLQETYKTRKAPARQAAENFNCRSVDFEADRNFLFEFWPDKRDQQGKGYNSSYQLLISNCRSADCRSDQRPGGHLQVVTGCWDGLTWYPMPLWATKNTLLSELSSQRTTYQKNQKLSWKRLLKIILFQVTHIRFLPRPADGSKLHMVQVLHTLELARVVHPWV